MSEPEKKKKIWTFRPKAMKKHEACAEREKVAEEKLEHAKRALDEAVWEQDQLRQLREDRAASA